MFPENQKELKCCLNCARHNTLCTDMTDMREKIAWLACWRPEGTALIYEEVEE